MPSTASARFPLAVSLVALCCHAAAQPLPDAGQILREVMPRSTRPSPLPPPIGLNGSEASPAATDATRFGVDTVVIQGNTSFSTDELLALVAGLPGPARQLADVQAAAQRITAHYRAHGFLVARAFVPAQDVSSGALRIEVVEGRIERIEVHNPTRISDARLSTALAGLHPGDAVTAAPIDRALLQWQDTPGVAEARATLQPGEAVGTTRLRLAFEPAPLLQGTVSLDNHGNAYTGRARVTGLVDVNSPLGLGERLGLAVLTSGAGLRHGRISFDLPVGGLGTRVGLVRHQTRYRLGGAFAHLQARGEANTTSAFLSHPFVLTPTHRLSATLGARRQSLQDRAQDSVADKSLKTLDAALLASWRDPAGTRQSSAELQLTAGRLHLQSMLAAAQDAASARTQGHFTRVTWELGHLQNLGAVGQFFVEWAGQRASRNLDSTEKFAIGGPGGVRAYGSGEANGDEADRLTLEWRQGLMAGLQGQAFFDIGRVGFSATPFEASAARHRTLSGVGIGLYADGRAGNMPLSLQASLAWPLLGRPATGSPVSSPALWVALVTRV